MKIIQELSEYIEEELNDSEKYIKMALLYKEIYPNIAETYNKLSKEEMSHVDRLHEVGVSVINEFKSKGNTVPEAMLAVYNYLHERHIEKANEVKMYQAQFHG